MNIDMDPAIVVPAGILLLVLVAILVAWRRVSSRTTRLERELAETRRRLEDSERTRNSATQRAGDLETRYASLTSIELEISRLAAERDRTQRESEVVREKYLGRKVHLEALERQVAVYNEQLAFAELGIYEPHFDFTDSEAYKERIREVRQRQKDMVSKKTATRCPTDWTVDGSRSKGETMVNRQTRLTLRAFNNECEAAIANTRWNNVNAMEKRIINARKQIEAANAAFGPSSDDIAWARRIIAASEAAKAALTMGS